MTDKNNPIDNQSDGSMNDPFDNPKLTAYALGELADAEVREMEQLISVSPELAAAIQEIRGTVLALEDAFAQELPLTLSENQRLTIAATPRTSGANDISDGDDIGCGVDVSDEEQFTDQRPPAKDTLAKQGAVDNKRWYGRQHGGQRDGGRGRGRWWLAVAIATVLVGGGIFMAYPKNLPTFQTAFNDFAVHSEELEKRSPSTKMPSQQKDGKSRLLKDNLLGGVDLPVDGQREQIDQGEDGGFEGLAASIQSTIAPEDTDGELGSTAASSTKTNFDSKRSLAGEAEKSGESRYASGDVQANGVTGMAPARDGGRDSGGGLGGVLGGGGFSSDRPQALSIADQGRGPRENEEVLMEMEASRSLAVLDEALPKPASPNLLQQQVQGSGLEIDQVLSTATLPQSGKRRMANQDGYFGATSREALKDSGGVTEDVAAVDQPARILDKTRSLSLGGRDRGERGKQGFASRETSKTQSDGADHRRAAKRKSKARVNKNAQQQEQNKSWKRVKALPNTSRLMVGDKEELDLTGMQVNVQVDGFRARVLIDYLYYNDRDRQLEGNFKLRLPEDSSLYYFAFGESANDLTVDRQLAADEFIDSTTRLVSFTPTAIAKTRRDVWRNVKEARMVPREQAAYAFRETVRRRVDPALVEWSGAGVFNTKVFPLAPKKVHRIVIGYDVNLIRTDNQLTYRLDLPENAGDCRIEINARDVEGMTYQIHPKVEPVEVDHNDRLHQRFTFDQNPGSQIRLTATAAENQKVLLLESSELSEGKFWATQVAPDLPVQQHSTSARAIFMLDTSLSSRPDKFNVWLKLLEATLDNNRNCLKEFGVLMFSVDGQFWQPQYVENTKGNLAKLKAAVEDVVLEGATDLYSAIEKVTQTQWVVDGQAPDLFLLSDGAVNWGETNLRLIGRLLDGDNVGGLFAYQTGMTGTAIANLRFLASETGGAVFSVTNEAEIASASLAHRNRPWQLKSISADGASDVLVAGAPQWVYPGQTLTVVGRAKVTGKIMLELTQAGQTFSVEVSPTKMESDLATRLYGQVAVGQLESMGDELFDISAAYARHFRITGKTCSLLMLESEADYQRFDIGPGEDELVINSKLASKLMAKVTELAGKRLDDPKAQLMAWLQRLETMQGLKFKMPTALKLAIEDIDVVPISRPLECVMATSGDVSKGYLEALRQENLDYDVIAGQAKKRGRKSVDDSVKVFSSLVERNPGDVSIARDVAFTAMELGRPAQAYHLLRRVARQRPFQGSVYPALGQCLTQAGHADMAIVYYEVALAGEFQRQGTQFRQIVAVDYMHLLRKIIQGEVKSSVADFAKARLETLAKKMPVTQSDVVVTMMWNQDQTDVDLHVIEPSGEECFYSHRKTRSGGQMTDDITTGFGPEMYFNPSAPKGKYKIAVKFFGNHQNRTTVKNKVYLNVFENFGSDQETVTRRTIRLKDQGEHRTVMVLDR